MTSGRNAKGLEFQIAALFPFYRPIQILGAILLTYLGLMSLIAAFRAGVPENKAAEDKPSADVKHSPISTLRGGMSPAC